MITSSQNQKIKSARALFGRPKERQEARAFIAEGVRLVEEATAANWPMQTLLYDSSLSARGREVIQAQKANGIDVEEVTPALLQSLSETETSQGILAILSLAELPIPQTPDFIVIADQIRDPGNLGTLLRSAAAAGAQAVLLPPETTDAFAPKVVRAGMGAHFRLPIRQMNWEQIEQLSKSGNLQILLADMEGRSVWETDLRKPLALIIGGEAEGASGPARKLANEHIGIPMARDAESLNAAMAGSVLMFEITRQRLNEGK
ncbi:MAG TPA: RNA methyltransferase [Anaerolineales bacterium]|jgi:TrmH family RNA methyltransferase